MNQIRYIQHEEVDKTKWDSCIAEAGNSLIYGYSWWLDHMSPGWHALVLNDYDAVMPLTWRKKYGIHYLYQPFCTAALGIFYKPGTIIALQHFFDAIPAVYKYWDIDLNEKNHQEQKSNSTYIRVNQMLSLDEEYQTIRKGYSRLANRNLAKAKESKVSIVKDVDPEQIVELYRKEYAHRHKSNSSDYQALMQCCAIAADKKMLQTYIALSAAEKIDSFYAVLKDKNFIYSLLGGSTEEGKNAGSFYLLTDAVIKDYAGSERTFRFEGSDHEGIAFFNSQFGALPTNYLHVKENKLPFLLRLFK